MTDRLPASPARPTGSDTDWGNEVLDEKSIRIRVLSAVLEPVVASVYFSPEGHDAFHALGFGPSSGEVPYDEWGTPHWGPCLMPDYTAYISSRGALMGNPTGAVVAATFGVFQPAMVIAMWNEGRSIASPEASRAARDAGAIAQLERILGPKPDEVDRVNELLARAGKGLPLPGRPMYAGLMSMELPPAPLGTMWRLGDRLREFRGDAFVAAWTTAGFGGCQIQLLTEILAGFPPRSYTSARGWTPEEMNQAEAELTAMGYVADGKATEAGRRVREEIEVAVDVSCALMVDNLGDDIVELVAVLSKWGETIVAAKGHAPATPQQQIMDPDIQTWMTEHGLNRFAFGPS